MVKKLKKIACIVLTAVITVSSLQAQPFKIQAASTETYTKDYGCFADAVEAMYEGKTTKVMGDYELCYFDNGYQYSVVKKDINTLYSVSSTCSENQTKQSCLWDARDGKATCPSQIKYIVHRSNVLVENINWDYDVIDLSVKKYDSSSEEVYSGGAKVAVNVRPSSPVNGSVTLPAYINDSDYGIIECVELGDGAFLKNEQLTDISIPDTYQRICAYAFTGCTNLVNVKFVTCKKVNRNPYYKIDTSVSDKESMKNSNIHILGSGAFAGCTHLEKALLPEKLLEGYMFVSDDIVKGFAAAYESYLTYDKGAYISSSLSKIADCVYISSKTIKKVSGDAVQYGTYFMGDGVYRDCYKLTSVELNTENPYIPAMTFAGCAKISEIKIDPCVKNITFGPASFAGADGNIAASEKTGLKKLDLTSENLQNVNICAYAFKNCYSLESVDIKANLNKQAEVYTSVQSDHLTTENAFENSFAEGASFSYEPRDYTDFTVPAGFFKNCKNLETISIMDNLMENDDWEKHYYTLTVGEKAFEGVGCKNLALSAKTVNLYTGSLYGLSNTDTLTLKGNTANLYGEPFSNTLRNFKTNVYTSLKAIQFDSANVNFNTQTLSANPITKSFTTSSTFYGVGSGTKLAFTENVVDVSGSASNLCAVGITYSTNGNSETHDLYHNGLGEISKIYFNGCNTTLNKQNPSTKWPYPLIFQGPLSYYGSEYEDVDTKFITAIYADGNTLSSLKNVEESANNSRMKVFPYTSEILENSLEWVKNDTEFRPENVNGGKGLSVKFGDNTNGYVPYSISDDDVDGFIIADMNDTKKAIANASLGDRVPINISYRGIHGTLYATIVAKKAVSMDVSQTGPVFEGATPNVSDISISNIKYNNVTSDNVLSDMKNVEISLETGNTYKAGENILNVTYMGCTKQVTITAEAEKVVSMSAIQSKKTIYPGDKLTKADFEVTAYYNSGRIAEKYTDFTIDGADILANTTSVKLISTDGFEKIVDISVSELKPVSLSVTYTGSVVPEGTEPQKKDFNVVLIYENGNTQMLDEDQFMLLYDGISANVANPIQVVYKLDSSIRATAYVSGIASAPGTYEKPVLTTVPETSYNPTATEVPGNVPISTPVNDTKISAAPTAPATQNTVDPTATAGNTVVPDNNSIPNAVLTGSSVSSTSGIKGVTLKNTKTSLTLGVGEKVEVSIAGASDVTYQSSNSKIVSVTQKGTVTAKKVGTADIVLTKANGNTMTCTVTVKKAPKKVKVNFTKKTLKKGKKAKIKVSFAKGYYSRMKIFKSSNKKIATVNSKGVITAKKKGTCKITVKIYNGKKATIKIKVK